MNENELKNMFSSADPKERVNTINAVIKGNLLNKLEILTWVAQNDPHAQIRAKVRAVVDQMQQAQSKPQQNIAGENAQPKSVKPSEETLKSGSPQDKIETLKHIINGSITADKELIKSLLQIEKDIMVCASLLTALGKLGGETEISQIGKFLNHTNARVRANAVEAIELIGSSMSFEFVTPLLEDADARVRANAAKCLYSCNKEKTLHVFESMVTSDEPHLVQSAIYALGSIDDMEAKKLLAFANEKLEFLKEPVSVRNETPREIEITENIPKTKDKAATCVIG